MDDHGILRVWDTADGREVFSHSCKAIRVVFHPDGKRLATAGGNLSRREEPGAITIWDAATGEELKRLLGGYPTRMLGLAYSPDGKYLASIAADGVVFLRDSQTHEVAGQRYLDIG